MNLELLVTSHVYREQFMIENFIGTADIFALVVSGAFTFESEAGLHTVTSNQGALFRKGILYRRKVTEPITMYLFRFRSDVSVFDNDYIVFSDISRIMSTISILDKLESGIFQNDESWHKHLFTDIVRQYMLEQDSMTLSAPNADMPVQQAISYIQENLSHKLVLSEIGEASGLSYVQFLRRFQSFTGMAPSVYINTLRIQKAKILLTDTTMMIKEIACRLGFDNEYYFSNFFKKHTGMSPSAFRNLTEWG